MAEVILNVLTREDQATFLHLLQDLLAVPALEVQSTLDHAGHLARTAFGVDKVDVLLYDGETDTLVARGTNDIPLAQKERAIGMDRLPVANGGRIVEVFQTGTSYLNGRVDTDQRVLLGFRKGLELRSMAAVPLDVNGERRGVITLSSTTPDLLRPEQLPIIEAVADWVGLVLHQAELTERVAQDAAEQARRMTAEELITVLAHDLKNYLTPLIGGIQIVQRRAQKAQQPELTRAATMVANGIERLSKLINDLLDVGRLEHGLFSLQVERINLTDLAQQVVTLLATPEAPIRVQAPEEVSVYADPNRLRQALENLLVNAQKHAPHGVPVVLEVFTKPSARGEWAVLHVRDEGPGVSAEVLPRLFARYGAGQRSIGLGLGLYLAHSIAAAHGGGIEVNSAPGQGASFCLSVPVRREEMAMHGQSSAT